MPDNSDRTIEKLLRQQAALAVFGSFALREPDLHKVLTEGARICAASLGVPFSKVCRHRATENDLLIEAGWGWRPGVVGQQVSQADDSSPQGQAYVTGEPIIIRDINAVTNLALPAFYKEHGVVSSVNVAIPAIDGALPYGVLEIDSTRQGRFNEHDIGFLTEFAGVLAAAIATATRVQELRDALDAKNLLADALHQRVRNNLLMIVGMLDSYARRPVVGAAQDGIDLIVRRVTTLAQTYDSLPAIQAEHSHPVRIFFVCHAEPVTLGVDETSALGMVVAELVANSYDHAFRDRAGTITVTLERSGPVGATLTVKDDGAGFPAKVGTSRNGLALVERLMARIGGTSDIHFNAGTVWKLGFPAPATSDRAKVPA